MTSNCLSMCWFSSGMGIRHEHCQTAIPHCDSGMAFFYLGQRCDLWYGWNRKQFKKPKSVMKKSVFLLVIVAITTVVVDSKMSYFAKWSITSILAEHFWQDLNEKSLLKHGHGLIRTSVCITYFISKMHVVFCLFFLKKKAWIILPTFIFNLNTLSININCFCKCKLSLLLCSLCSPLSLPSLPFPLPPGTPTSPSTGILQKWA